MLGSLRGARNDPRAPVRLALAAPDSDDHDDDVRPPSAEVRQLAAYVMVAFP